MSERPMFGHIPSDREKAFVHKLLQLSGIQTWSKSNVRLASALSRHLILDGTPLIGVLPKEERRFYRGRSPSNASLPPGFTGMLTLAEVDPTMRLPKWTEERVAIDQFLGTEVVAGSSGAATVRDVIRYVAHVDHGVHSGIVKEKSDFAVAGAIKVLGSLGLDILVATMSSIARNIVYSLTPGCERLRRSVMPILPELWLRSPGVGTFPLDGITQSIRLEESGMMALTGTWLLVAEFFPSPAEGRFTQFNTILDVGSSAKDGQSGIQLSVKFQSPQFVVRLQTSEGSETTWQDFTGSLESASRSTGTLLVEFDIEKTIEGNEILQSFRINSRQVAPPVTSPLASKPQNVKVTLGCAIDGKHHAAANVHELIKFPHVLSAQEKRGLQSYLSLRWD